MMTVDELAELLGLHMHQALVVMQRYPSIKNIGMHEVEKRMEDMMAVIGVSWNDVCDMIRVVPVLITKRSSTLQKTLLMLSDVIDWEVKETRQVVARCPALLMFSESSLKKKLNEMVYMAKLREEWWHQLVTASPIQLAYYLLCRFDVYQRLEHAHQQGVMLLSLSTIWLSPEDEWQVLLKKYSAEGGLDRVCCEDTRERVVKWLMSSIEEDDSQRKRSVRGALRNEMHQQ